MDASECVPVVGPFPTDELEISLVRWITRIRLGWSVAGLATAAFERPHYRRPRLAAASAVCSMADAAWAVARSDRRDDVAGVVVGTAISTGALVAVSVAAGPADQFGGLVDWAFHATLLAAGLTPFRIERIELGALLTAVPIVAYVATVSARSDDDVWPRPLANGVQFGVMFGTAAVLSRALRRSSRAIVAAQRAALVEVSRTAAEAARLRNAVVARGRVADGLIAALALLVEQAALSGGHVDFVPDLDAEPPAAVAGALAVAVSTAFDWLAGREEGVRCVLRVTGGAPSVELTIRQRHLAPQGSIGLLERALSEPLFDVDGSVEVSAPSPSGIRIVMRVP